MSYIPRSDQQSGMPGGACARPVDSAYLDLLPALTDAVPVMLCEAGPDRLARYFNKQWLVFTGRSHEQIVGSGWEASIHPDDHERCVATYVAAFDAQRECEMQYRMRRADGEYRLILDRGAPMHDSEGEMTG